MQMNRRGFLQTCLALAAAPAIVRADSLMRIVPRELSLILPGVVEIDPSLGAGYGLINSIRISYTNDIKLDAIFVRAETLMDGVTHYAYAEVGNSPNTNISEAADMTRDMVVQAIKSRYGKCLGATFTAPPPLIGSYKSEVV